MVGTREIFLAFIFTIAGVYVFENFSIGIVLLLLVVIGVIYVSTKSNKLVLSIIVGTLLGITSAYYYCTLIPNWVLKYNSENKEVTKKIEGVAEIISSKPTAFGFQYTAVIKMDEGDTSAVLRTYDTTMLLLGDRASFSGTLKLPENFESEYGKIFDYKNYLRSKGVFFIVENAKLSDVQKQSGFSIRKSLDNVKNRFESSFEKVLHEPAVSLVEGMILGDKGAMTKADSDSFRKSGLIHIVVLSGYNISIVVAFILALLRPFPRKFAQITAVIAVVLFVLMSGASATAVRAGIMGSLVIAGSLVHRKVDVLRLLSITGIVMTVFSPLSALYDPSFQLSFLATFGLVTYGPWVANKLSFVTEKYGLREISSATIGSQIMTLPFLAYSMGVVSVVSFFSNILVLPFAPFLMLSGFLTGIFSLPAQVGFLPIIYLPFTFITHLISSYIFKVSEFFAGLPFSVVATPIASAVIIVPFYVFLIVYGFRLYKEEKLREKLKE